jgi:hypothetical protein
MAPWGGQSFSQTNLCISCLVCLTLVHIAYSFVFSLVVTWVLWFVFAGSVNLFIHLYPSHINYFEVEERGRKKGLWIVL